MGEGGGTCKGGGGWKLMLSTWRGNEFVIMGWVFLLFLFFFKKISNTCRPSRKLNCSNKNKTKKISYLLSQVSSISTLYHLHVLEIFSDLGMILHEMRMFFSWLTNFSKTLLFFHWNLFVSTGNYELFLQ